MNINLLKLFELCGKHEITFKYKINEDATKNEIIYNETKKILVVTLVDHKDINLSVLVDEKIKELENIFH